MKVEMPEFWESEWEKAKKESFSHRKRKSLQESIELWNQKAERFNKNVGGERGQKRVQRVFSWLESRGVNFDGSRVLDIGAGPGVFTLGFAGRVKEVVALEPAGAMVAFLKKQVEKNSIDNVRVIQDQGFQMSVEIWDESRKMENEPEEAVSVLKEELRHFGIEELPSDEKISEFVHARLVDGIFHQDYLSRTGQVLIKL
jgi:FkbM family methyltransferase